ncbi:hypothetical protein C6500_07480 [Candidatus Poribacteria bacterium]|nr:MAG: hypothetical protein C6500_07480 [Candidatus Poribacteria bacterium]
MGNRVFYTDAAPTGLELLRFLSFYSYRFVAKVGKRKTEGPWHIPSFLFLYQIRKINSHFRDFETHRKFPHVRGAMNCATTNGFFANEKRLFRNGIISTRLTR